MVRNNAYGIIAQYDTNNMEKIYGLKKQIAKYISNCNALQF